MVKSRIIILVAVLASVVLALAYWGSQKNPGGFFKKEATGKELLKIDVQRLTALQLNKKDYALFDYAEIKLEKKGDQWKIVKPFETDADQQTVNKLIESLLAYKFEKKSVAKDGELSDYGLSEPVLTLSVEHGDGHSTALLVGKESADGKSTYVSIKGQAQIYVVDRSIENALSKTIVDLRDRSLGLPKLEQIESMEILPIGGKPFEIKREGPAWKLVGGNSEIKEDKLAAYFAALSSIQPKDIIDKPSSQVMETFTFGASATMALHLKNSDEVWRLILVIYIDKYAVAVTSFPGRVFRYDSELEKALRWNAESFLN